MKGYKLTDGFTFIYGLVDPRDGRVRYIGKANDPERRLSNHFACQTPSHKRNWLLLLRKIGLSPRLIWLCKVPKTEWEEAEKFQIAFFRLRGMADLNVTDGGGGVVGWTPSTETKSKMRKSKSGHRFTEEHRRRISSALLGHRPTPETLKRLSESHLGQKNCFGYKHSMEARANMSAAHIGYRPTPETRLKLSQARKGHVTSEETRKKIGNKSRGRKHTDETKIKMRAAWVKRAARNTIGSIPSGDCK